MNKILSGCLSSCRILLLCTVGLLATLTNAQTITNNAEGYHDGFFYSFWSEGGGTATFTFKDNGRYASSWTDIQNWVGGKGWKPGGRKTVKYSGSYNAKGTSYLALYGWTKNPLVEYYIVENWVDYNPSTGSTRLGTINSDGGTYDIYRTKRENKPSIIGNATFYQYWSIRRDKRSSGVITSGNHFDAWARSGLQLGDFDYMVMGTEGFGGNNVQARQGVSGNSDITVSEITGSTNNNNNNNNTNNNSNTGSGSNTIIVRAKGTTGGQSITLKVNNKNVATWALTTGHKDYTAKTNLSGDILVDYTNDQNGGDAIIDYIKVNGLIRQAENQSYNSGAWANGRCGGGSNTEYIHCNGAIGFGKVSATNDTTSNNNTNNNNNNNTNGTSVPTSPVRLQARHSGKCLDAAGNQGSNGTNIQQYACGNGNNQKWSFYSKGGDWYEIKSQTSGRCLQIADSSNNDGANAELYDCYGGNHQQYKLAPTNSGYFTLKSKGSGSCVDVSGASTNNGANIHHWACYDGTNQQFKFN